MDARNFVDARKMINKPIQCACVKCLLLQNDHAHVQASTSAFREGNILLGSDKNYRRNQHEQRRELSGSGRTEGIVEGHS